MKFWAIERERIASQPAYSDAQGKALAPLPGIYIRPEETPAGTFQAEVFLMKSDNKFVRHVRPALTMEQVRNLLLAYELHPEFALQFWFSYRPPSAELTIEDLDL